MICHDAAPGPGPPKPASGLFMGYTMVTRLGGIEYRYTGSYSHWSLPLRNPLHSTSKSVRVAHTQNGRSILHSGRRIGRSWRGGSCTTTRAILKRTETWWRSRPAPQWWRSCRSNCAWDGVARSFHRSNFWNNTGLVCYRVLRQLCRNFIRAHSLRD